MVVPSALYGWSLPELSDPPAGDDQLAELAADIEATISSAQVSTWIPTWTSTGSPKPANPASISGRYTVRQGWCDFGFTMTMNSSTTGGVGTWAFSLPVKAHPAVPEQMFYGMLLEPQVAWFPLHGLVNANDNLLFAFAPVGGLQMTFQVLRQSDGGANSYIPRNAPGPVQAGGRVTFSGRYLVA